MSKGKDQGTWPAMSEATVTILYPTPYWLFHRHWSRRELLVS